MLLVDLFCKAGGATKGYQQAGYYVVGVDIEPQPNYCGDEFIRADALTFPLDGFDVIHASPPCQGYSRMNHVHKRSYPRLIDPIRARLRASGLPYVIENVEGAPLLNPITLCGVAFGLKVIRHRLFESSVSLAAPDHRPHIGELYEPTGHGAPNRDRRNKNPHLKGVGYTERCRQAMDISWMNRDELGEAIPPAYTENIGRQLAELI